MELLKLGQDFDGTEHVVDAVQITYETHKARFKRTCSPHAFNKDLDCAGNLLLL